MKLLQVRWLMGLLVLPLTALGADAPTEADVLHQSVMLARQWVAKAAQNPAVEKDYRYAADLKLLVPEMSRNVSIIVEAKSDNCGPGTDDVLAYLLHAEAFAMVDTREAKIHMCESTLKGGVGKIAEIIIHEMFHFADHVYIRSFTTDTLVRFHTDELRTTRDQMLTLAYAGQVPTWSRYLDVYAFDYDAFAKLNLHDRVVSKFYFIPKLGIQSHMEFDVWRWVGFITGDFTLKTLNEEFTKTAKTSPPGYMDQMMNHPDANGVTPLQYAEKEGPQEFQWLVGKLTEVRGK